MMTVCRYRRMVMILLSSVWICSFSISHAAVDELVVKGETMRGKVEKDEMSGVELVVESGSGARMTIKPSEIESINFDVSNGEYHRGLREMGRGAYLSATESFAVFDDKESLNALRPIVRPYVLFLYGECLYRGGKTTEAIEVLQRFLKEYPTSRYVDKAVGSLVDSAIQTKNFKIVPPLLEKLVNSGQAGKAKALYYGAKLKLEQGDVAGAGATFAEAAEAASDAEDRALARLGQAECAIKKNDLQTAKKMAEEALMNSSNAAVAGTAYMIVGEALFNEVDNLKGDEAQEKLMDALLEFMRIPIVYGGDRRTEPKALFYAGECLRKLSKFRNRGKDKRRALSMYNTIIQKYGGTSWGKKASESVKLVN